MSSKREELVKNLDETSSLLKGCHPGKEWKDTPVEFTGGSYCYSSKPKSLEYLDFPNPRDWTPEEDDWKLQENWQEIIHEGFKERLNRFRSLKVFMDICVRCGACADKCHFFIGTGDPKNMPVIRAELLRSIYRNDFTFVGKLLKGFAGARKLTEEVIKEWFMYFFQCSECRRCSVYCPYGIDTAEITMMGRELLNLLGITTNWIMDPASNCNRTGNHLGLEPHTFKGTIENLLEDVKDITGVTLNPTFNRKGAEILFIAPSGDAFADPGIYTMMGYMMLFEHIGLDYTISTYASEGGNFGLFNSNELMKKLNAKMYHEAERLGVKWILGGECGHMWRVVHQYMDTMNGPTPSCMEVPQNPITGTVFQNAASTKMVHIMEFTADLIRNNKLKLDKRRNDHIIATYHDSCNPARAMGMFDEPRYVIENVCNNFYDMPENTIREETFCCGGGSGLNTNEIMDLRMLGGLPRANAVKYVHEKHNVNTLACVCAIDRATLPPLMEYWVPDVEVTGVTEMVANALIMEGENDREEDLREREFEELYEERGIPFKKGEE